MSSGKKRVRTVTLPTTPIKHEYLNPASTQQVIFTDRWVEGPTPECNIHIKKLPPKYTASNLIRIFKRFGQLLSVYIPARSKPEAIISFKEPESARKAAKSPALFNKKGTSTKVRVSKSSKRKHEALQVESDVESCHSDSTISLDFDDIFERPRPSKRKKRRKMQPTYSDDESTGLEMSAVEMAKLNRKQRKLNRKIKRALKKTKTEKSQGELLALISKAGKSVTARNLQKLRPRVQRSFAIKSLKDHVQQVLEDGPLPDKSLKVKIPHTRYAYSNYLPDYGHSWSNGVQLPVDPDTLDETESIVKYEAPSLVDLTLPEARLETVYIADSPKSPSGPLE